MVIGAIIIIGGAEVISPSRKGSQPLAMEKPLGCVEVMGRSVVERMVERFLTADVEVVSIVARAGEALPSFRQSSAQVAVHVVDDLQYGLSQLLNDYSLKGIEFAFVALPNVYTECDLIDWVWFHRGTHQAITRACDRDGSLDFWLVDCAKRQDANFFPLLEEEAQFDGPLYVIRQYVNRVRTPGDFRRLVTDAFRGRCEMRPPGKETRPGVWVEAGAQIDRRARIVAPAYIGRGVRVREGTLITRCSNIESWSCIDYGTAIDDSSVLSNSYIGTGLDVSHVVVNGNWLANVARKVVLEISDASVIRENIAAARKAGTLRQRAGISNWGFWTEAKAVLSFTKRASGAK